MLSQEVQAVLRQQGWSPDRKVPITDWVAQLRSEGYTVSPEGEAILQNFGGLEITPAKRSDDAYAAGAICFDPVLAATGEFERVDFWQKHLGQKLTPLGELEGQSILLLTENGRVFYEWGNEIGECGESFEDALELTLVLARRRPIRWKLDAAGHLVTFQAW